MAEVTEPSSWEEIEKMPTLEAEKGKTDGQEKREALHKIIE